MRFFLNNIAFIRRIIIVILIAVIVLLLLTTRCSNSRMRFLSEVYAYELLECK